jgi:DNA-directed RNA polymerase specialized sigma24 family protein
LETASLPNATLAELYRFAWLLSGDAKGAECILGAALAGLEPKLDQVRSAKSRNLWLVRRIRQTCLEHFAGAAAPVELAPRLLREDEALVFGEILEIEAYIVAQHVHALAEPGRTALALFYLDLVSTSDAAELLGLPLEEYCETVGRARMGLHAAMSGSRAPVPQPA